MLGHKSAKVTLDTYAALFPDDLDNVTSALSRQRSGTAVAVVVLVLVVVVVVVVAAASAGATSSVLMPEPHCRTPSLA